MSRHASPNHIPCSQAQYGKTVRFGNEKARASYPSYNNCIIDSRATPTIHSTSPSRIPETSRSRSRSPYNVLKDIAAVSSQYHSSTIQSSTDYFNAQTSPGRGFVASRGGFPPLLDNTSPTPHPRQYTQFTSGSSTRPIPVASTSIEYPALVQPGTSQSKSKKRKAFWSPSGSDGGNDANASASRANEEENLKNTKAQASSKEREKERHWLALLRRLLFGEETTYSTRHNGVRQVEVTHTKLKVLQGAFEKIIVLQKQVNALESSLQEHKQQLQEHKVLIGLLQSKDPSFQTAF